MAIGLGLMIGFRFPVNFDRPYASRSITEFWRRWHISLSSFLRDYLYLPLGGNRRGSLRTYVNLGLTMLLGGLWHGANWTFLAWGAYQGSWLIAERAGQKRALWSRAPGVIQTVLTFVVVVLGWVLFRSETLTQAGHYLAAQIGAGSADSALQVRPMHWIAGAAGALVVWGFPTTLLLFVRARARWALPLQLLFLLALLQLHHADRIPFLYFQF
jgi:alginate O-acetyltransferase complex protein AlgI